MSDKEESQNIGKVHAGTATIVVITLNGDLRSINTIYFDDLGKASKYAKTQVNKCAHAAYICPIMAVVKPATAVEVIIPTENARLFFPDVPEIGLETALNMRRSAIEEA